MVPVLMTSCQVSLKWKIGPVAAHTRMTMTAARKVAGFPVNVEAHFARRWKRND